MERDYDHVTIAEMRDGTWRVCVQWLPGDPLHCYALDKAARLAADARGKGDHELSEELHKAIRDATDRAATSGITRPRFAPRLVADPDDAKRG
jgi:hypothetical protein